MPPVTRVFGAPDPARLARLERVRDLLELRRHPERRTGLFSATTLTRVVLRLVTLGLAAGFAGVLFRDSVFLVPMTAVAVGAADYGVDRLWRRIRERVRRAWNVLGLVAAGVAGLLLLVAVRGPDSAPARTLSGWWDGFVAAQNAKIDARQRARRIPVDSASATGDGWRLLTEAGSLRWGTLQEARVWCAELGPGWALPDGLGALPDLDHWPALGTLTHAWTRGGSGIQLGDGRKPAGGVSGTVRPTEVRAVLCLHGPGS